MIRRLQPAGEEGIALVMALLVMAVSSAVLVSVIQFTGSSGRDARGSHARQAAYGLAEAGANYALSVLAKSTNPTLATLLPATTVNLPGGTTTYSGVLSGSLWTLTGVGSVANPGGPGLAPVTRTVNRVVSMSAVSVGSFSGLWDRIYSDATGVCSVTINAGMNIPSNFGAKGDVCLNSSSITGSTTIVDIGGKVTITGSSTAATAGPAAPTAGTGWTNPTNVYTTNSVYATNIMAGGATGANQDTTGFGFAIPAGATIVGITANIRRKASIGAVGTITHDASSSTNASSVSSTSWSHTVANQVDRMLVVGVTSEHSTSGCQPSGVTYSGQALTAIAQTVTTTGPYVCASQWYLSAPPVGTANVVVTFGGTIQYVTAGATSLYNVQQGAPDAFNSSFSDTGLTSTSVTTVKPNSWVLDSFGGGQPGALTAGAGQTSRWTQTVGSQAAGGMSTKAVVSAGSTTMSWTQPGAGTTNDVLADNPVSYWRLGETSGTTAVDQMGVNNGTYTGGYTLNQTGALADGNKAVLFNGSSGYVNLGNPASLQLTTGTLEAWFKTANAGTSWRDIICKESAWCLLAKSNILGLYSYNPGGDRATTINVADNAWHHVAATFQNGVTNGTKLYLDGNLVLTTTVGVKDQTKAVQIGNGAGLSEYFAGTIDDVAVYNTLLSAARIQRHYAGDNRSAQVVAAFAPAASGLVDSNVALLKGGAPAGSNYATGSIWSTADTTIAYGSSADLWGTTWTPAEVNASNFGVRLAARNVGSASATASLDSITVTVNYETNIVGGIGTTGPIARANIAGTCKYNAQIAHTPCSAADRVSASTITISPTNLTRPTINWQYWYDNAAPGPRKPCTTSTGTPPAFDSNTTYDGLNADKELTPESSSYTCQAKDASGAVIGELSWNHSTRVMTIKGTIFFDGKAGFRDHDVAAWHYRGRGVIYISRDWHNDEPVCAGSATTNCRTTGMPAWDTNADLMVLVVGGKNAPGNDVDFHRDNSAFQGAIYATNTCRIEDTAYMQGPLNCGALDFNGDSPSFFAWPPLPSSADGQIYTTGTDSDVQLVLGAQTG